MIRKTYLTEEKYNQEMKKIEKENKQKEYQRNMRIERNKFRPKMKFETSKLIALYLFALLNAIVVYAMVAMWKFVDFTYLGVLISDIAAQVLIYAIYCMKAYKAKRSEEQLKFEREKINGSLDDIMNAGAICKQYVPTTKGDVETFAPSDTESLG